MLATAYTDWLGHQPAALEAAASLAAEALLADPAVAGRVLAPAAAAFLSKVSREASGQLSKCLATSLPTLVETLLGLLPAMLRAAPSHWGGRCQCCWHSLSSVRLKQQSKREVGAGGFEQRAPPMWCRRPVGRRAWPGQSSKRLAGWCRPGRQKSWRPGVLRWRRRCTSGWLRPRVKRTATPHESWNCSLPIGSLGSCRLMGDRGSISCRRRDRSGGLARTDAAGL